MPVWFYTIKVGDVFHNEDMTFEQRRDEIVKRLRSSDWFTDYVDADDQTLPDLVDELADAEGADEFDAVWHNIYDLADEDRAWIDVWSPVS